jgi:hypothetical protein
VQEASRRLEIVSIMPFNAETILGEARELPVVSPSDIDTGLVVYGNDISELVRNRPTFAVIDSSFIDSQDDLDQLVELQAGGVRFATSTDVVREFDRLNGIRGSKFRYLSQFLTTAERFLRAIGDEKLLFNIPEADEDDSEGRLLDDLCKVLTKRMALQAVCGKFDDVYRSIGILVANHYEHQEMQYQEGAKRAKVTRQIATDVVNSIASERLVNLRDNKGFESSHVHIASLRILSRRTREGLSRESRQIVDELQSKYAGIFSINYDPTGRKQSRMRENNLRNAFMILYENLAIESAYGHSTEKMKEVLQAKLDDNSCTDAGVVRLAHSVATIGSVVYWNEGLEDGGDPGFALDSPPHMIRREILTYEDPDGLLIDDDRPRIALCTRDIDIEQLVTMRRYAVPLRATRFPL